MRLNEILLSEEDSLSDIELVDIEDIKVEDINYYREHRNKIYTKNSR